MFVRNVYVVNVFHLLQMFCPCAWKFVCFCVTSFAHFVLFNGTWILSGFKTSKMAAQEFKTLINIWHDSITCNMTPPYVTGLIYMENDSFNWTWLIHMGHDAYIWDMTHSYVTWPIQFRRPGLFYHAHILMFSKKFPNLKVSPLLWGTAGGKNGVRRWDRWTAQIKCTMRAQVSAQAFERPSTVSSKGTPGKPCRVATWQSCSEAGWSIRQAIAIATGKPAIASRKPKLAKSTGKKLWAHDENRMNLQAVQK